MTTRTKYSLKLACPSIELHTHLIRILIVTMVKGIPKKLILLVLVALSFSPPAEAFSAGRSSDRSVLQKAHTPKSLGKHGHGPSSCTEKTQSALGELQMNTISSGGAQDASFPSKIRAFTQKNSFILGMVMAVMFAKTFPSVSLKVNAMLQNTIYECYSYKYYSTRLSISLARGKWRNYEA